VPSGEHDREGLARTWFTIDGSGERLDLEGQDAFRFPEELARVVVDAFSEPGDVVFDPFASTGAALAAAHALGRTAIGVERDARRVALASGRIGPPSRVIHGELTPELLAELPQADLVFTSPPHITFGEWDDEGVLAYWDDFDRLFASLSVMLKPSSRLVVHLSNPKGADGLVRTAAFESAIRLSHLYQLVGEFVRCNTGPAPAALGADHSYVFVFRSSRSDTRRVKDVAPSEYL